MRNVSIYIALFIIFTGCDNAPTFVKDIDGNNYRTKDYAGVIWMTENLKVQKGKGGETVNYYYPNNNKDHVEEFGLLYDFENACKVCPKGWELPSNEDWDQLFSVVEGDEIAGKFKLAEFWKGETNTNDTGFSVVPAGIGNPGEFDDFFHSRAYFWSKTSNEEYAWAYNFAIEQDSVKKAEQHPIYALSVRCIKKTK